MEPEDLGFGLLSEDEKTENFEKSTLKLVLGQMGFSKASIRGFESSEGLTAEWFTERFLGESRLVVTRIFRFNLTDILYKPGKSEVVEAFTKHHGEFLDGRDSSGHDFTMVFKVDGVGRMVATTWDEFRTPAVLVPHEYGKFFVTTFPGFFAGWLGANHEDL